MNTEIFPFWSVIGIYGQYSNQYTKRDYKVSDIHVCTRHYYNQFSEEEVIKSHSSYFSHIFHRAEYKDRRTLNFIIINLAKYLQLL